MAYGRMKYRSRSRRSYSYAYPHHVRHGDRVTVSGRIYKHGESERTRTRTPQSPDMPRTPQNRRRLARPSQPQSLPASPQPGIGSRIGDALQSPAGQAALQLAARALAARFGLPMLPPGDMLALPPPRD